MLLTAQILLTIATLGYSLIPAIFDSNNTHVTNPSWDKHARFHVVWQVSSYVYVALLALFLIWTTGGETWNLWLAAILAAASYGGFWTAVLSRPSYEGTLISAINPVPDFSWKIGGKIVKTDANVTLFTGFVIILIAGVIAIKLV